MIGLAAAIARIGQAAPTHGVYDPAAIDVAFRAGRLDVGYLRVHMLAIWQDWPRVTSILAAAWVELFRATGYLDDGVPAPAGPLTVYRAARPQLSRGMSWSTSLPVARFFQTTYAYLGEADVRIYVASVSPAAVLAGYRIGPEYVIDPAMVRPRVHEPAPASRPVAPPIFPGTSSGEAVVFVFKPSRAEPLPRRSSGGAGY